MRVYGRLQNAIDRRPSFERVIAAAAESFLRNPQYMGNYVNNRPYETYMILRYADLNKCFVTFRKIRGYTVIFLWQGRGDVSAFSYRDILARIRAA